MTFSITLSFGANGGFYVTRNRICLWRVALTWFPYELEDVLRRGLTDVSDVAAHMAEIQAWLDKSYDAGLPGPADPPGCEQCGRCGGIISEDRPAGPVTRFCDCDEPVWPERTG